MSKLPQTAFEFPQNSMPKPANKSHNNTYNDNRNNPNNRDKNNPNDSQSILLTTIMSPSNRRLRSPSSELVRLKDGGHGSLKSVGDRNTSVSPKKIKKRNINVNNIKIDESYRVSEFNDDKLTFIAPIDISPTRPWRYSDCTFLFLQTQIPPSPNFHAFSVKNNTKIKA